MIDRGNFATKTTAPTVEVSIGRATSLTRSRWLAFAWAERRRRRRDQSAARSAPSGSASGPTSDSPGLISSSTDSRRDPGTRGDDAIPPVMGGVFTFHCRLRRMEGLPGRARSAEKWRRTGPVPHSFPGRSTPLCRRHLERCAAPSRKDYDNLAHIVLPPFEEIFCDGERDGRFPIAPMKVRLKNLESE